MPETDNTFSKGWQEAVRSADIQKQLWFLAAVFGGKNPVVVDATKIEIKYSQDDENYIIRSKGKSVKLPGEILSKLMDKMMPETPKAASNSSNTYGTVQPVKQAVNQYGVAPKKKVPATEVAQKQNTQEHYGTVARVKNPQEGVMANISEVKPPLTTTVTSSTSSSSGSSAPAFNPVTTGTSRAAALTKAAELYGSTSAAVAAGKVGQAIYGEMPPQPPQEGVDKATPKSEPKKR